MSDDGSKTDEKAAFPETQNAALADELYTACLAHPESKTWRQEDLLKLGIARDTGALMSTAQILMDENKFQAVAADNNAIAFTVRGRSAASKYASIKDPKAVSVYKLIETAGAAGIWKQAIKKKLNLHENVVEKALKSLQGSKHVKQLKAARNTAKKTYILYELEPTKDVTGGAWFSEGDIDSELIEIASQLVVQFVRKQSWMSGPKLPKLPSKEREKTAQKKPTQGKTGEKRKRDGDDEGKGASASKKVQVNGIKVEGEDGQAPPAVKEEIDDFEEQAIKEMRDRAATDDRGRVLIPFPAGYQDYPTASSILDFIDQSGIIEKDLSVNDMGELLQRLVYDGQLEKMPLARVAAKREIKEDDDNDDDDEFKPNTDRDSTTTGHADEADSVGYRWVRRPDSEYVGVGGDTYSWDLGMKMPKNGFSETPCSRCPVFKLCGKGGPVDANSCDYYKEWF